MTISNTSNKAQFSGNGVVDEFPFTYKVFSASDVQVYSADPSEVETVLVLDLDYTVELNEDQNNNPGGVVTITIPPATGYTITLLRVIELSQETDITTGGGFYPEVVEDGFDKLTMIVQQLEEGLSRTVQVDVSSTLTPAEILEAIDATYDASAAAAANSEASAIDSAASASASAASALDSAGYVADSEAWYDTFRGVWYGSLTSDPATDPLGNAVGEGDAYFNSSTGKMRVYHTSAWQDVSPVNQVTSGAAADITYAGSAGISATNVEAALDELDSEKQAAATASTQGKQTIWIPANAMIPRTTNPAVPATAELSSNKVMMKTLDFADGASALYAQFQIKMPKSWNASTVTASFTWTANSTSTNSVVWGCRGLALANDETMDAAFGTAQTVTDANTSTAYQVHQSAETSAITISSSPAKENLIVFEVYRDPTNGSDTLAVTAMLLGVTIYITTDASNDA